MKNLSIANVVAILNEALGEAAPIKLAECFGGKRIDIPLKVGGRLLDALGAEITTVLVDHYGGCKLDVPSWGYVERLNTSLALRRDILGSGLTANEIAFRHGVTSMWVRKLRARMQDDPSPPKPKVNTEDNPQS